MSEAPGTNHEAPVGGDGREKYERDQVIQVINSVIERVSHADTIARSTLKNELSELKHIIEGARKELSAVRPSDIKGEHIPSATDELDAVVEATESATGTIMDSCDVIQTKAAEIEGDAALIIQDEVMKIYEACSFQDITGQRITKVGNSINAIDEKVTMVLDIIGSSLPGLDEGEPSPGKAEELMNGPQLPENAVTQDDIDKILAEFDG